MPVVILIVVIIALVVIVNCVKIVPQAHAVVVERLGGYLTTWSVGLHFKVPFIDRIAKRVLLKEQVVDFPPQPVITKDNVTMQIDTVVYFQICCLVNTFPGCFINNSMIRYSTEVSSIGSPFFLSTQPSGSSSRSRTVSIPDDSSAVPSA
jgi:hypothetical protein